MSNVIQVENKVALVNNESILNIKVPYMEYCNVFKRINVRMRSILFVIGDKGFILNKDNHTVCDDIEFYMGTQDGYPSKQCGDEINLWEVVTEEALVRKFNLDGTDTGFSFSTKETTESPTSITWDGKSLWVADSEDGKVYKYNLRGNYLGVVIDITEHLTDMGSVAAVSEWMWVADKSGKNAVQFTDEGEHTGYKSDTGIPLNSYFIPKTLFGLSKALEYLENLMYDQTMSIEFVNYIIYTWRDNIGHIIQSSYSEAVAEMDRLGYQNIETEYGKPNKFIKGDIVIEY